MTREEAIRQLTHLRDFEDWGYKREANIEAALNLAVEALSAAPPPPRQGWRTIDSVKRDGRAFLALGTLHQNGWLMGEYTGRYIAWWDKETESFVCAELGGFAPTYWMPLPEPPND